MISNKKMTGVVSVYKRSVNCCALQPLKELIYTSPNISTFSFPQKICDLLTDDLEGSTAYPFEIGYFQVGQSAHTNILSNSFFELAHPLSKEEYGRFASNDIQERFQIVVKNPFVVEQAYVFDKKKAAFARLENSRKSLLNTITSNRLLLQLTLDEHTANGVDISEIGVFVNNGVEGREEPALVAYKAFGITDGAGTSISIPKTEDYELIFEWAITLEENVQTTPVVNSTETNPDNQALTADTYLPTEVNPNGNSWVCYFPSPVVGKDPPTSFSTFTDTPKSNVNLTFIQKLLNNGLGVVACDYTYPLESGTSPIMTSAVDSNHPMIASSIHPLVLSGATENAYTEAAQMTQFAKSVASSVGFTASSMVFAGEGFGGTLAAWMAYAPDLSGSTNTYTLEHISTRGLGVAMQDAPLDWYRWWPFRLGSGGAIYDFSPFAIPKQLDMSGTVYGTGGDSVLQLSTTDNFTGDWATSTFRTDPVFATASATFGYTTDNFDASGNLFWSSIPGVKSSYQFVEIPELAKKWYSPLYHASGGGSSTTDGTWGATVEWGHVDNSTTYFHADYSGSSLSALGGEEWSDVSTLGGNLLLSAPYPYFSESVPADPIDHITELWTGNSTGGAGSFDEKITHGNINPTILQYNNWYCPATYETPQYSAATFAEAREGTPAILRGGTNPDYGGATSHWKYAPVAQPGWIFPGAMGVGGTVDGGNNRYLFAQPFEVSGTRQFLRIWGAAMAHFGVYNKGGCGTPWSGKENCNGNKTFLTGLHVGPADGVGYAVPHIANNCNENTKWPNWDRINHYKSTTTPGKAFEISHMVQPGLNYIYTTFLGFGGEGSRWHRYYVEITDTRVNPWFINPYDLRGYLGGVGGLEGSSTWYDKIPGTESYWQGDQDGGGGGSTWQGVSMNCNDVTDVIRDKTGEEIEGVVLPPPGIGAEDIPVGGYSTPGEYGGPPDPLPIPVTMCHMKANTECNGGTDPNSIEGHSTAVETFLLGVPEHERYYRGSMWFKREPDSTLDLSSGGKVVLELRNDFSSVAGGGAATESVSAAVNIPTNDWTYIQTPELYVTSSLSGYDEVKATDTNWIFGNQFRLRVLRNDAYAGSDIKFYATGGEVRQFEVSGNVFDVLAGTGSKILSSVAGSAYEPVLNLQNTDFSHKYAYGDDGWNSSSFGETSTLHGASFSSTNSYEDPFYGFDMYSHLSSLGSHATSSVFRHADPNNPRNNATNFLYPNENQAELSAQDRATWILKLASNYDSWYDQFL